MCFTFLFKNPIDQKTIIELLFYNFPSSSTTSNDVLDTLSGNASPKESVNKSKKQSNFLLKFPVEPNYCANILFVESARENFKHASWTLFLDAKPHI